MDLKHGGLENLIMNVLWNSDIEIMSVNDVWCNLNNLNTKKKWAYTTVKTVLDRLETKGFLIKIKTGKKYQYKTIIKKQVAAEKALKKVALDFFFDDFSKMADFVKEMAYEEEKNSVNVY